MASRKEEQARRRAERLEAERRAAESGRRRLILGYVVAGLLSAAVIAGIVVAISTGGGDGEVRVDGEELPEKALAQKYNVRFTPTFQFFPESADGLGAKAPEKREVARIPGYLKPEHFLAMFRYVRDKAYERVGFRVYLKGERG